MRIKLNLLLILILSIQCKNLEQTDLETLDWQSTEKSKNYDDYATFIQKHPETDNFEKALSEYFFLKDSIGDFGGCYRFNASVSVIDNSKVLFDNELKSLDSLRFYAFNYLRTGRPPISNMKVDIEIPESRLRDSISRGRFDISIYNKPFPIEKLKVISKEISLGIEDYKEYLSNKWFNKSYSELTQEKKLGIDKLNDSRLVFFDFSYMNDPRFSPPPEFYDSENETEE